MSFSFGNQAGVGATTGSNGFSLGTGAAPSAAGSSAAPATSFSFGGAGTAAAASGTGSGFSFGNTSAGTGAAAPAATPAFGTGGGFGTGASSAGGAGGFSFGAAPAATTAAGDKAQATAAPAASSGFSFGAAPAATTAGGDKGAATASSGFSFGAAPAAAAAAGDKSVGDAKPVSVSAAESGGATAGTTLQTPATGAATPSTGGAVKTAAAEYSTMDVRSIVQQWYQDLAKDAVAFEKQARRVAMWDQQLRDNQRTLEETVDNVHRIMASQSDLKAACDTIEVYQAELDADISNLTLSLDAEVQKIEQQQQQQHLVQEPTEDDFEREKAFVLAEDLNQTLNQMELNLKRVVTELNKSKGLDVDSAGSSSSAAGAGGGAVAVSGDQSRGNPIAKIVQVLNHHHESLAWLDEKARSMQRDIAVVKQELSYRTSL